jgi:hypothetical protein
VLPDFPAVKKKGRELFESLVRTATLADEPILAQFHHFRVHEGNSTKLTRADQSGAEMTFGSAEAGLTIPKEDMKSLTPDRLVEYAKTMASQLAKSQTESAFTAISKATEEVGNVVSAKDMGLKEAFLEMLRKVQVDFDRATLKPKYPSLVLHPSQLESFAKAAKEWEQDPAFMAEMARIDAEQLEAWRARENRRRLVD